MTPDDKKDDEGKEESTNTRVAANAAEPETEKMETSQTDTEKQETIDSNAAKSKIFHDNTPLNIFMAGVFPTYKCSGLSPDQSQSLLRPQCLQSLVISSCSLLLVRPAPSQSSAHWPACWSGTYWKMTSP